MKTTMASAALVGVEVAADAVPLTSSAKVFMVVAAVVVGAGVVAAEEVADEGGAAEGAAADEGVKAVAHLRNPSPVTGFVGLVR